MLFQIIGIFLAIFAVSVFAGGFGALAGIGGGMVVVPILTTFFGVDIHYAIGASIVSVIATSSGAAATYVRENITNIRIGMFLEMGTTFGALTGAFLGAFISGSLLYIVFAVVLAISAYLMWNKRREDIPKPIENDFWSERLHLSNSYYDKVEGHEIYYNVRGAPVGLGLMYVAGLISGLLGIGSGALKVLAMDTAMHLPIKVSTATSNFMIGVTAATSAGVYFARGQINPYLAAPVALGVLSGSQVGTNLLMRLRGSAIRKVFIVVLVALTIEMFLKGFGINIGG